MILKQSAIAGAPESGDVQVSVSPNPGEGIHIELKSSVKARFGDAILETVRSELERFEITEASVRLLDKGALDCVIRSQLQCAICRSAQVKYDWTWEDKTV